MKRANFREVWVELCPSSVEYLMAAIQYQVANRPAKQDEEEAEAEGDAPGEEQVDADE